MKVKASYGKMHFLRNTAVIAATLVPTLVWSATEAPEDINDNSKVAYTVYKGEKKDVVRDKEKGVLEGDRNYNEKSDFVEERDRLEGKVKKALDDFKR